MSTSERNSESAQAQMVKELAEKQERALKALSELLKLQQHDRDDCYKDTDCPGGMYDQYAGFENLFMSPKDKKCGKGDNTCRPKEYLVPPQFTPGFTVYALPPKKPEESIPEPPPKDSASAPRTDELVLLLQTAMVLLPLVVTLTKRFGPSGADAAPGGVSGQEHGARDPSPPAAARGNSRYNLRPNPTRTSRFDPSFVTK